jgi:hypothetical protein
LIIGLPAAMTCGQSFGASADGQGRIAPEASAAVGTQGSGAAGAVNGLLPVPLAAVLLPQFGVGVEALNEAVVGVRLELRMNNFALLGDLGYSPTDSGGSVGLVRLSARRYFGGFFFAAVGLSQGWGPAGDAFADITGGVEVKLGMISLSCEVGPVIPLTHGQEAQNTNAFMFNPAVVLWF